MNIPDEIFAGGNHRRLIGIRGAFSGGSGRVDGSDFVGIEGATVEGNLVEAAFEVAASAVVPPPAEEQVVAGLGRVARSEVLGVAEDAVVIEAGLSRGFVESESHVLPDVHGQDISGIETARASRSVDHGGNEAGVALPQAGVALRQAASMFSRSRLVPLRYAAAAPAFRLDPAFDREAGIRDGIRVFGGEDANVVVAAVEAVSH